MPFTKDEKLYSMFLLLTIIYLTGSALISKKFDYPRKSKELISLVNQREDLKLTLNNNYSPQFRKYYLDRIDTLNTEISGLEKKVSEIKNDVRLSWLKVF